MEGSYCVLIRSELNLAPRSTFAHEGLRPAKRVQSGKNEHCHCPPKVGSEKEGPTIESPIGLVVTLFLRGASANVVSSRSATLV